MKNQITVLAMDLGSSLGWCRCVCTLRPDLHITVADHVTVYLDTLTNERMKKEYNEVFSRSRVKMIVYEEVIRKLVDMVKFDAFITEDVFCNPRLVSAFRSLSLYMETLERIVNIEKQKRLYTISPTSIKEYISAYGQSDKGQVQAAVLANKAITMKNSHTATEHEFDAVAAVWSFVQKCLMTLG